MNHVIEAHQLSRRFGSCEAVRDLELRVAAGGVYALLGPNGAGKTTTIHMLMNIVEPSAGTARVLDADSRQLGPAQFSRIGYVSENQSLPGWMTVDELLAYYRPFYPTWDGPFATRLLSLLDLPHRQRIKTLSRGMRMKASLISSLAYHPALLVLDEPFSGLDPLVRDELIRGVLEVTRSEGWSVFVSSHDVEEVERLADWVGLMGRGTLHASESLVELQRRVRRVEVVLAEGGRLPDERPASWLSVEATGRSVRILETQFDERRTESLVRQRLGPCASISFQSLPLREILRAHAQALRLGGALTS